MITENERLPEVVSDPARVKSRHAEQTNGKEEFRQLPDGKKNASEAVSFDPQIGHSTADPIFLDSFRLNNVLPSNFSCDVLEKIIDEVGSWAELLQKGKPNPRLVSVQGDVDERLGIEPLFRDLQDYQPDLTPWSPTVKALRDLVSNTVAQPLNHAILCYYRHGEDYLSETSCPTLDLSSDSTIVKLSLGATRTLILRPKRKCGGARRPSPRPTTKVELSHGSVLCIGPRTNRLMTHEIKRASQRKARRHRRDSGRVLRAIKQTLGSGETELDSDVIRICITFRHVATFQSRNGKIFGKGATVSTLDRPDAVPVAPKYILTAIETMKEAFRQEIREADFDRLKHYGAGFDVLPFQYVAMASLQDIVIGLDDGAVPRVSNSVVKGISKANQCFFYTKKTPPVSRLHRGHLALEESKSIINIDDSVLGDEDYLEDGGIALQLSQNIFVDRHRQSDMIPDLNSTDTMSRSQAFSECSSVVTEDLTQQEISPTSLCTGTFPFRPRQSSIRNGIALLALDLQNDFLGDAPTFYFGKLGSPYASRRPGLLERIRELSNEVRRSGGVVFMVKSQYGAWSSPQTKQSGRHFEPGAHMDHVECCGVSSAGADFYPEVEMMIVKQDVVLIKEWYSAFMGTTLDSHLRRLRVGHIVVCGIATDESVAATVKSAYNLGYNVILSSDGTAQVDEKLQKSTETKLAKYYTALLEKGQALSKSVSPDPFLKDPIGGETREALEIDALSRLSGFGAGDSIIVPDFLETTKAADLLEELLPSSSSEINWNHVNCEGRVSLSTAYHLEPNDKGHLPVYRSGGPQPWDTNFKAGPFTDSIQKLKSIAESQTGHKLNWGQIQCYRDGSDSTGWNADKNLDVRAGSTIAAVSLGGDRVLELKPKKDDLSLAPQRLVLHHNSLMLLGPETTRLFLHSLPPVNDSTAPHLQFVFLDVATFFAKNDSRMGVPALYGQGAEYGSHAEMQDAEAARRTMEQLGMALAGVYTMSSLSPGRGVSATLTVFCTIVVAAGTAMWFRRARRVEWREHQSRLYAYFEDSTEEPLSVEEARHRILNTTR